MAKRRKQRPDGAPGVSTRALSSPASAPASPTRSQRTSRPPRGRPRQQPTGPLGADMWRIGIIGAVLLGLAVVVVAVVAGGGSTGRYTCGQELQPGGSAEDGQVVPNMGFNHVATGSQISYLYCPPTSGSHYSEVGVAPARPGFYDPSADIGPGSWVHNLEHGYVVALYRCQDGICPSDDVLAELRRFVNNGPQTAAAAACGLRTKILAARFDQMSTPFALLTWDRALLLQTFDIDVANTFANRWMEKNAREPNNC